MVKPPLQYPAVASFSVSSTLGTIAALAVATLVTSTNLNWRYAFLFGAFVAITGTMARTTLKETPDFIDAKRRIKLAIEKTGLDPKKIENNDIVKEKNKFKNYFMLFFNSMCLSCMELFRLFLLRKYFNRRFWI
ncbi:MFS transporter [Rickettsia felis]|uniref:MFS transporter n=1 Tax=Rickettsia felis TaxID=42862 RepID=UPI000AB2ED0C|nr:MFS transporter [Rickettsia felis]